MPRTAPAPNNAMSQPNSASLASSTSRTNTMPVENSAPRPSATAAAAGITARTSGIRNAPRKPAFSVGLSAAAAPARSVAWAMQANDTRNVSASIQNTSACVRPPMSLPGSAATAANAAAPNGMLPYDDPRIRPLASGSSLRSTMSGIDASRAGRNTMLATSTRKAHR